MNYITFEHLSTNSPSEQFHPQRRPPNLRREQPPRCLLSSHEDQKISVLRIFNSRLNSGPTTRMMSKALATSSESPTRVPSSRYQAWRRSLQLSLTWWIRGCNTRAKRSGPNGSLYCTPVADIIWPSPRYNLAACP